jgi:hypothetical protein
LVTAPLAAVFTVVAIEMVIVALDASLYWRIGFVIIASLATLLAGAMLRETLVRIRGRRRIVVTARELILPEVTIPFREIKKLEITGERGSFQRVLEIQHANGKLELSGVMLGSVGELDEIHGLIKAARKAR